MACVTKNRSGGCGCRRAALGNGVTYANYNYSPGCNACANPMARVTGCGCTGSGASGWSTGCSSCGGCNSCSPGCGGCTPVNEDTWPYYSGSCPGTTPINGCPGFCRMTNGLPCGYFNNPGSVSTGNCGCGCEEYVYDGYSQDGQLTQGFFTHIGELNLEAGSGVPFSGSGHVYGMFGEGGQIRVRCAGWYLISYQLTLPVNQDTNEASFYLTVDGERVNGSDVRLYNSGSDAVHGLSGQAIVHLRAHSTVSLVSDAELFIIPREERDTLASLTLTPMR